MKTIIYCFDAMRQTINSEARDAFLLLQPAAIIEAWLEAMVRYNARLGDVFDADEMEVAAGERSVRMPFLIARNKVKELFDKVLVMQEFMTEHPRATHLDLLTFVNRDLGRVYGAGSSRDE